MILCSKQTVSGVSGIACAYHDGQLPPSIHCMPSVSGTRAALEFDISIEVSCAKHPASDASWPVRKSTELAMTVIYVNNLVYLMPGSSNLVV